MQTRSLSEVTDVVDGALAHAGVPTKNAVLQRDLLVDAELRGVASHGLLRLPRVIERIRNGVSNPTSVGDHTWLKDCFLAVDGQSGLGPVVAMHALDVLCRKAETAGVAVGAVKNSNHIGMLAFYSEYVASKGQALIALSTSEALVHPWGGRKALLGTNPISIGVPTEDGPFVMDTATSIVSMGEIHDRASRDESIPSHWALDRNGDPTTSARAAKVGSLAPFGDAKGYAFALAFELLVSSLAGSALGSDVAGTLDSTNPCNKGDLFIVIDGPSIALGAYLEEIRSTRPAQGFSSVRIPGEGGRALRERRKADGIPVDKELWERLRRLAGAVPV